MIGHRVNQMQDNLIHRQATIQARSVRIQFFLVAVSPGRYPRGGIPSPLLTAAEKIETMMTTFALPCCCVGLGVGER